MTTESASAQSLQELKAQLAELKREMDQLKGDRGAVGDDLDPSLDDLMARSKGLTFNFYGESKYNWTRGSSGNYFDPHRFVLIPQYKVNDWIHFTSELELEHGGTDDSDGGRFDGELELEQFHADVQIWGDKENNWLTWRSLGVSLIPVGSINLVHEPDTFYSVHRPIMYKYIIPSTWMEGSTGFMGDVPGVEGLGWQFMISTGLSSKDGQITDSKGVRSTRPNLRAKGENNQMAYTMRMEYAAPAGSTLDGFSGSASTYITDYSEASNPNSTSAILWDVEGSYLFRSGFMKDFELIADYGAWHFGDPDAIADANVGDEMYGYRFELAYHWRYGVADQKVVPYFRYEGYNTSSGGKGNNTFTKSGSYNYLSYGASWYIDPQMVLKAGMRQSIDQNSKSEFSIGVGYHF